MEAKGDGNCLLNSISILITGSERLSSNLRDKICLEIIENYEKYFHKGDEKELFLEKIKYFSKNGN
jgi:hypothetical protein